MTAPVVPTIPGTHKVFGDGGISGAAILVGAAGWVLVTSGAKGVPIKTVLQAFLKGQKIPSAQSIATKPTPTSSGESKWLNLATGTTDRNLSGGGPGGGGMGAAVAAKALSYQGVPYVWAAETPEGWDCSGFVTWVLHHDFGLELPSNVHTTTPYFYVWSGARTVPTSECQAGDLVCWPSHIGIAINATQMVNAPGIGQKTQIGNIYSGAIIRRPLAYGG